MASWRPNTITGVAGLPRELGRGLQDQSCRELSWISPDGPPVPGQSTRGTKGEEFRSTSTGGSHHGRENLATHLRRLLKRTSSHGRRQRGPLLAHGRWSTRITQHWAGRDPSAAEAASSGSPSCVPLAKSSSLLQCRGSRKTYVTLKSTVTIRSKLDPLETQQEEGRAEQGAQRGTGSWPRLPRGKAGVRSDLRETAQPQQDAGDRGRSKTD